MLTTALVYLLIGIGLLALLGVLLTPLALVSGVWAWQSGKADAAAAAEIDRVLAEG